jgi:hypothetical protein
MNQQKGGNTKGGRGGNNSGNGGAGGSFSVPVSLPPMPMRRDIDYEELYARDFDDFEELFERDAALTESHQTGAHSNHLSQTFTSQGESFPDGQVINIHHKNKQTGGNIRGHNGASNSANGANAPSLSMSLGKRFLNGGAAKGGDSRTKGGNTQTTKNNFSKGKYGDGNVINANTMNQQKGGNTKGGRGGNNSGNGGGGGSFSVPVSLPPMPMRRDVDDLEYFGLSARDVDELFDALYARDAYADPEAFAEPEFESEGYYYF